MLGCGPLHKKQNTWELVESEVCEDTLERRLPLCDSVITLQIIFFIVLYLSFFFPCLISVLPNRMFSFLNVQVESTVWVVDYV